MTLRAAITSDASSVFLSTGEFAETVTYHPHTYYNATPRSSRSISAVVIRETIAVLGAVSYTHLTLPTKRIV